MSEEKSKNEQKNRLLRYLVLIMLPLSLLLIVLLVHQIQANQFDEPIEIPTNQWKIRNNGERHIPMIVKDPLTDQKIFVSGSLKSSSALQLDFEDERESCVVPQELKYNSISKRQAFALGNGKVIVSVYNSMMKRGRLGEGAKKRAWIVTIIDPKDCSYTHVQVAGFGESLVTILPYVDSFDILLKNHNAKKGPKTTKVVRYGDDGKIIEDFKAEIKDLDFLKVLIAKEFDPTQGYYYIEPKRQQGVSIVKKLAATFDIKNTYEIEHSKYLAYDADAYSVQYDQFSICYFDQEIRTSQQCVIVNGDLGEELTKVAFTTEDNIYYVNVVNLPRGGAAVVYAVNAESTNIYNVYARRILQDGVIGDPVALGDVPTAFHDLVTFVRNDEAVCVVVVTKDATYDQCVDF